MSRKKPNNNGIIYSTDPDFRLDDDKPPEETLPPGKQRLIVRLDTKQRAGKAVSIVEGFAGSREDLGQLCRELKTHCGTGGSAKDGEIIIQGDQRGKITQWLIGKGYLSTKLR